MNMDKRRLWPMVMLASWLAFPAGPVTAQQSEQVEKPVPSAGEHWTYRRTDLWKNEESERFRQDMLGGVGDHLTVLWTISSSADARRRGSVTYEYLDGATLSFFDPKAEGRHVPLLFPLYPGKRWQFQYKYNPVRSRLKVEQTAVVEGWEDISVPAGRFRALLSRYHRERLAGVDLWRQRGRHEMQVAPGWREVFETEADIAPAGGIVRIMGRLPGSVLEMRLITLAQTPDQGIPAWQVEVAPRFSQVAMDRSSTALLPYGSFGS